MILKMGGLCCSLGCRKTWERDLPLLVHQTTLHIVCSLFVANLILFCLGQYFVIVTSPVTSSTS